MTEVRNVLRIQQDVEQNPQAFMRELQRNFDRISEVLDDIQGHRGAPKFYSDINLQGNRLQFNDSDYVRQNELTSRLQAWNPDTTAWANILDEAEMTKLTTALTAWTLVVSDDATDFTMTWSAGTDILGVLGSTKAFEIGASNTIFGQGAGDSISSGTANTIYGFEAGDTITTGQDNVVIGYQALANGGAGDPDSTVAIGYRAGYVLAGNACVFVGFESGLSNTTAVGSVGVGYRALRANVDGAGCLAIGYDAGLLCTGAYNTCIGAYAGDALTSGTHNLAIGYQALTTEDAGDFNVAIGSQALSLCNGAGYNTGIGYYTLTAVSSGTHNLGLGYTAGATITTGDYNIAIGSYAMSKAGTTTHSNIGIGYYSLEDITGVRNTCIGYRTMHNATSADDNVSIGYRAGRSQSTSNDNVFIGSDCAYALTSGASNVLIGKEVGYAITTGQDNVILGYQANYAGSTDPDANVAIGYQAGYNLEANQSVAIGYQAGYTLSSNGAGVFLGYQAGYSETAANKLYIANSNTATPLIGGTFPNTALVFTSNLTTATGGTAQTPDEITATDGGVAASLVTTNTEVTTNGDEDLDEVTLANGTTGQVKRIYCVVAGHANDTWKITPATMCGGTQITFTGVGEGCILVYADNEGWVVAANNGGTIA